MGWRGIMSGLGMNALGMIAMGIALLAFVVIVIRTYRRPQEQIDAESRLWMDEENR